VSEIHKFLFEGVPVRGVLVRLTDAWTEILRRRAGNSTHGAFPPAVQQLLGEMTAAAILMQSNIKFDGALVLQVLGDGPVKLAVVEVQPGLGLRATATVNGDVAADASLSQMVNPGPPRALRHHAGSAKSPTRPAALPGCGALGGQC
jgi:molecular chaperone Hsp33